VVTPLWGQFTSTASNVVTLNLKALDGRLPTAFNFAGTGTTGNDAVATAYTVNVPAALSTNGFVAGAPVRFFGFVNRFGAAPPAFSALSFANYALTSAKVEVEFTEPAGNNAPFTVNAGKLVVSQATLQGSDEAKVRTGPMVTNIKSAAPAAGLTIQSTSSVTTSGFVIGHKKSRRSDSYSTFADMVAALQTALPGGSSTVAVREFEAEGSYDSATSTLTVKQLYVQLND